MPGREIVTISDGISESAIVPDLGAGLAWYDLVVGGKSAPIFRPCRNPYEAHPLDLALNLLVPWSNRISNGGFTFEGVFHRLEPICLGRRFPFTATHFQVHGWSRAGILRGRRLHLIPRVRAPFATFQR
jgi:aldose 1-epimerase